MAIVKFSKYAESLISLIIQNLVVVFLSGFLFFFFGRNFLSGASSEVLSWFCYFLSALLFLTPFFLFILSEKTKSVYIESLRKSVWLIFILGFTAILFYFLQLDDFWNQLMPKNQNVHFIQKFRGLQKFLQISYLTLLFGLFVFSILFQSSLKAIRSESDKALEVRNVALNIIILFSILVTLNYAAKLRPASIDLTTLGKYTLSNEGSKILKGIDKKVTIVGFYPFFHDVYREVDLMLQSISSVNSLIEFTLVDAVREKDIADSKEVDRNGYVVFESLDPNELEANKRNKRKRLRVETSNDLKLMEKDFVSAILSITREKKKIYFTTGHGEIPYEGKFTGSLVSFFRKELKDQNYALENLNVETGFPTEVPKDAAAVLILGAKKTFIEPERKTLIEYLFKRNGRILLCLDPTLSADFSFLLSEFKLKYVKEKILSKTSIKGKADFLIASNYEDHPITNSFSDLPMRHKFSIFPSTGFFEKGEPIKKVLLSQTKEKDVSLEADYQISYIVKTNSDSWVDKIRNSIHDSSKEPAKVRDIAFAIEKKNSAEKPSFRLVAFGDTDFIKNQYFTWPGKQQVLSINSLKWLIEDEDIMGILPKKIEGGKVELTEKEDDLVFYLLVFVWPLFIFASTFFYLKYQKRQLVSPEVK